MKIIKIWKSTKFDKHLHQTISVRCCSIRCFSSSRKHAYIILTPLHCKPHFFILKMGFTGVHIIFLIYAKKHRRGYSLEPPRRGGSNEYPESMF